MPRARYGTPNDWLTCVTIDPDTFGATRDDLRVALEAENIESRPVWKPLHLQPAFEGCRARCGVMAEAVFEFGLCLPSGSNLSDADQERVVGVVREVHRRATGGPRLAHSRNPAPLRSEPVSAPHRAVGRLAPRVPHG
jgi:pyridoxal phosphate-dependent aminotransferase EpsN